MRLSLLNTICLVAASLSAPAWANNDTALYAEAAPADASFVRFLGYGNEDSVQFDGKTFELSADTETTYIAVSAAHLAETAPGSYVTVARRKDGSEVIVHEASRDDAARVYLFLVNASDMALDLRLADGSTPIIQNVEQAQSGVRAVNPVAVSLGVFAHGHDQAIATFDLSLRRGQNVSFVADDTGVRLIENRFGPVLR